MKKILAITGIRSDYDLMSNFYKKLKDDPNIDLKLLVSGAHLSETYGYSVKLIEEDGIDILLKIESLIDSGSKSSRIKTASILLQNSIDIVAQYNPDLIIYAGDREEVLVGGMLGGYLKIPTIHFFGGDHVKDGHIDNQIRHATAKLSSIHFVSIEEHKERLINMGESSERIFVIGSPALDKFITEEKVEIQEVYRSLGVSNFDKYALVIYHSLNDDDNFEKGFENILLALKKLGISAFVSYPNTDPGNKKIIKIIEKYSSDKNFCFYKNLDRNTFVNIYRNAYIQIGNSSCGVVEAASIPLPVVNVGIRQRGRKPQGNVIFVEDDYASIEKGISKITSEEFSNKIKDIKNIYGDGYSAQKAYEVIKSIEFNKFLDKKEDPIDNE